MNTNIFAFEIAEESLEDPENLAVMYNPDTQKAMWYGDSSVVLTTTKYTCTLTPYSSTTCALFGDYACSTESGPFDYYSFICDPHQVCETGEGC